MYKDYEDNFIIKNKSKIISCFIILLLVISIVLLFYLNRKDKYEILIKDEDIILAKGNNYQIESNNQELKYNILDLNIARVNDEGKIIGIKEGSTNLIISNNNSNNYKIIKVLVVENEEANKKVELKKEQIEEKKSEVKSEIKQVVEKDEKKFETKEKQNNKQEESITDTKQETKTEIKQQINEETKNNRKINISWSNGFENSVAGGGASRVYSLPNGVLVGGSEREGKIYTVYSSNNGNTWSNPIIAASLDGKTCANINFFYDANVLYMAYRATSGCDNSKNKCYTSFHVNASYDNGKTWTYHSKIVEHTMNSKKENRGYWEPFLGKINNKLTVFYANDSLSSSWQNIESLTWNGLSWTNKTIISNGKSHSSRDGMPAWTRLSNGMYVLLIESSKYRKNNHPFVIQMLYSKDGVNWSDPKDIYIPSGNGSKAAAPGIVELSTGQLVISFQTDEDSRSKGDNYSVCKTIYSDGTSIESITKNNFSKPEKVFTGTNGLWPSINYYNGLIYVAGGSNFKRLNVG